MRKLIITFTLIMLLLTSITITAGLVLSTSTPIRPGSLLFPIQRSVEKIRLQLTRDKYERASYMLVISNHRLADLEALVETSRATDALQAFDDSLTQLIQALSGFEPSQAIQQVKIWTAIQSLLLRARPLFETHVASTSADAEIWRDTGVKIDQLLLILGNPVSGSESLSPMAFLPFLGDERGETISTPSAIDPVAVLFPPGSVGAQHAFYPLVGKHAVLECQSCHLQGVYRGTGNTCESCHTLKRPANHFVGACYACHSPVSWTAVNFDHALTGATDCLSCHAGDQPAGHYPGQCSACHNTSDWRTVSFDHRVVNAMECQDCHAADRPANHYAGQCSACHGTNAWADADFNHQVAGAVDCQTCHAADEPANHFTGQCSSCHSTNAWLPVDFDHSIVGNDCQSCHGGDRPANHFEGQCSSCHSTNAWRPANFDHSNAGNDCQSCHSGDRPSGHYDGQCSSCHSTNAWRPAAFDHAAAGATDCLSCHSGDRPSGHFDGQCSSCHSTNAWQPAAFDHAVAGATDCLSCHSGDRPSGHFDGQCSDCHSTSSWSGASIDHTFPTDHEGANNECSACHTSSDWDWTCYNCHDQAETEKHHEEKDIFDIAQRCLECHPTGNKD